MSSPNPPLLRPDLSNIERRLDPVVKQQQSRFEDFVAGAQESVQKSPMIAQFRPEDVSVLVDRLARARFDAAKQEELAARSEELRQLRSKGAMFAGAGAELGMEAEQEGSVLDATGFGPLRNADTVGDVVAIGAPIVASQIARRIVPPKATQAVGSAIKTARAMLTANRAEITGGILGAAAGGVLEKQLDDASAALRQGADPAILKESAPTLGFFLSGPVDENGRPQMFEDRFTSLASAALREATLEAAGMGAGELVSRGAFGVFRALVGDETLARRALEEAEKVGVPVGLVDVVDKDKAPLSASIRRIFAVLGPTGTGFRENFQNVQGSVRGAAVEQIRGLSSEIGVLADMAARGEDVNRLAKVIAERGVQKFGRVTRRFTEERDRAFGQFMQQAGTVQVAPANLLAEASQLSARFNVSSGKAARLVKEEALDQIEGLSPEDLELLAKDVFENLDVDAEVTGMAEFAKRLGRLEPNPTIQALDELSKEINSKLMNTNSKFVAAQLMQFRRAIDTDIRLALSDKPQLLKQLDDANALTEQWMTLLGGAAGKRTRTVLKDFGSQRIQQIQTPGGRVTKNPGANDPTQLIDVLSGAKSPGEVAQLRGLLGTIGDDGARVFRQVAATRIQRAMASSLRENRFNVKRAFKAIGLLDSSSTTGRVTTEFITQAGGNVDDLKMLARVAERAIPDNLSLDAAATAMRRATLGTTAGALAGSFGLSGFTTGAAVGGVSVALATAAFAFALGRGSGYLLSNPTMVRAMIDLGSPSTSPLRRTKAFNVLAGAGFLTVEQAVQGAVTDQGALLDRAQSILPGTAVQTPLPPSRN